MGFEEEQSKQLLEEFTTVQAAINSPTAKGRSCSTSVHMGAAPSQSVEAGLWSKGQERYTSVYILYFSVYTEANML